MDDHTVFFPWILERHAQLGTVTEVRVLRCTLGGERSTWAGYYGPPDREALINALRPVSPQPRRRIPPTDHARNGEANFYFSLNGVRLEMAEGRRGRLARARETARDIDIAVTTLFPIDIDPVRPSNTSATDQEKLAALEVADEVDVWLAERNVFTIRADSGNGYHLLIPLKPIRGEGIARAARDGQTLLKLLDARFSRPEARVDKGNFNPSRIFKLYGTLAVKGTSTRERPHRLARIDLAQVPSDIDLFGLMREELEAFKADSRGLARSTARSGGMIGDTAGRAADTAGPTISTDRDAAASRGVSTSRGAAADGAAAADLYTETDQAAATDRDATRGRAVSTGRNAAASCGTSTGRNAVACRGASTSRDAAAAGRDASTGRSAGPSSPSSPATEVWRRWRQEALAALPLESLYGDLLTGVVRNNGWLECRDPSSPTGDRNPSAGVADGSGSAERGTFHSFISGNTISAFDFVVEQGLAADFRAACAWMAELSSIPLPSRLEEMPRYPAEAPSSLEEMPRMPVEAPPSLEEMPRMPVEAHSSLEEMPCLPGKAPFTREEIPPSLEERHGSSAERSAEHPAFNLTEVEAFVLSLSAETEPPRTVALIREYLETLVHVPVLEQNAALEILRKGTGFSIPVLKRTITELREAEVRRIERPPRGVQVLDIVRGEEAMASIFKRLVALLAPHRHFFARRDALVFVRPGSDPLPVTEASLPGLLSGMVELRMFQRLGGRRHLLGYEPLPPQLARAFVNSPFVRDLLPPLATFCRAPFFASDWSFIAHPGYYPLDGGIFYDGPAVKPRRQSTRALDTLLRGTPWQSPTDRVNFFGVILTALTISCWTNGHPVVAVNGNKSGIGKSLLAQTCALVMEGVRAESVTFGNDQAEFEKQIATQVEKGFRFIFVDNINVRQPVQSAVLERTVSDWTPNFRRLGSNSTINRHRNDLLFCLTMNRTRLGPDMRRRSLPVNLFAEERRKRPEGTLLDPKGWLLEHWLEIVAELAGMVMVWLEAGRPMAGASARHSTSDLWASTVDAILRANGLEGFLSNYDTSMGAFDQDFQLMLEVCREHRSVTARTASEWAALLGDGLLEERFKDRWGKPKSAHAQTLIVARLFQAYREAVFEVDGEHYRFVRSEPEGPTHSPVFVFEKLERDPAPV